MDTKSTLRWFSVMALALNAACSPQKVSFDPAGGAGQGQSSILPGSGIGGGGSSVSLGGSSCTTDLGQISVLTKLLFIVDQSGSNEGTSGCTLGSGCTDPGKHMRASSINKFLFDYGSKTNFQWNFEIFQDIYATSLTLGFTNAAGMQSAMNTFLNRPDTGNTPYLGALELADRMIRDDPDLNGSQHPQYLIVFMSDGQPSDALAPAIISEVQDIMALSPGKITFNTVYYGTGTQAEAGLLETLAQTGNGHFLNTNTNPTGLDFAIKDLINVPCP